jgi:hypothetical protein
MTAIPASAFDPIFRRFDKIVDDYVHGRIEDYQRGIEKAAKSYVDTMLVSVVKLKSMPFVSPSVLSVVVHDRIKSGKAPSLQGVSADVVDSVTDDFGLAIFDAILKKFPIFGFLRTNDPSHFPLMIVASAVTTVRDNISPKNAKVTVEGFVELIQEAPRYWVEKVAFRVISDFVNTNRLDEQTKPSAFFRQAMGILQSIRKSDAPMDKKVDLEAVNALEQPLLKLLSKNEQSAPAKVIH